MLLKFDVKNRAEQCDNSSQNLNDIAYRKFLCRDAVDPFENMNIDSKYNDAKTGSPETIDISPKHENMNNSDVSNIENDNTINSSTKKLIFNDIININNVNNISVNNIVIYTVQKHDKCNKVKRKRKKRSN